MARLAYISFDQVPAPKGAATHIEAFVRALSDEFGAIDLVTVSPSLQPSGPIERWTGVFHWELPALGANLIDRALAFGRLLNAWLASREYEIIHFRSIFEGLPILKHRKRAALVFEVNGLPSIELKYRYPGSEDDRDLMRKIEAQERACLAAAQLIVTPSAVTRDFLVQSRGALPARIAVIPNGVDTSLFRPVQASAPVAMRQLLYFGTLSPWQGVDHAIRAIAGTDASLTILGTGSRARREGLAHLASKLGIADRVTLRDPVSQLELARELASCDGVLAPLLWNDRNALQGCCPLKVLEGMAAGRPVISSDLEAVRQLGTDEQHFLLTKPGSVDALAAAINRLCNDPQLALKLATNARQRVEERYTWAHANSSLIARYHDVIGQQDPSSIVEADRVPVQN